MTIFSVKYTKYILIFINISIDTSPETQ